MSTLRFRFRRLRPVVAVLFAALVAPGSSVAGQQTPPPSPTEIVAHLATMQGSGKQAIQEYRKALGSQHAKVRAAAAQFLAKEAGRSAIPDLAPLVEDRAEEVQIAVAAALVRLGGPGTEEPIRKALSSPFPGIRAQTAGYLGDSRDNRFIKDLGRLVGDANVSVRETALQALRAIGSPKALPYAMAATADSATGVVLTAIGLIESVGDPAAVARLKPLCESKNNDIRSEAAHALVLLADPSKESATLQQLAADPQPSVRRAVLRGLHDHPTPAAVPLIKKMATDKEPRVRRMVVLAAKVNPEPGAVPILEFLLGDSDPSIRASAVQGLGQRDGAKALARATQLAGDPSDRVRSAVASALGELGDAKGLPVLDRLMGDPNLGVRLAAVGAVGAIGTPGAVALLDRATRDKNRMIRIEAVRCLGALSDPSARKHLRRIAGPETDPELRVAAMEALGKQHDTEAVPVLKQALKDPAEAIRRAARKALDAIERSR